MYHSIGSSMAVRTRTIIGIFDLDITSQSIRTRRYLARAEKNGEVTAVTGDLPKSFVISGTRGRQRVYLSQLSTATLLRRSEQQGWE